MVESPDGEKIIRNLVRPAEAALNKTPILLQDIQSGETVKPAHI
ncbi:hypothetical protein JCM19298_2710 [Nonlabens ulvanivorans]|nr:hypothetical protein JCM19297_925 [Nonlabens ulvanivorans]GAK92222.1 hypothetical protein JCM19298_2710 [Nonlabens ulvanivorans]